MKELLTYVARNLVDHPEQVSVNEIQSDGETRSARLWRTPAR